MLRAGPERLCLLGAFVLSALLVHGQQLNERQNEQASDEDVVPLQWRVRRYQGLAVVGSRLFLHGGMISDPDGVWIKFQDTYSLPLDQAWNNFTVDIYTVDNGVLPASSAQGAFWADPKSRAIYRWGGRLMRQAESFDTEFWNLTITYYRGREFWSVDTAASPNFYNIRKRAGGLSLTCGENGLYFGGVISEETDPDFSDDDASNPARGLVSFDMRTKEWSEDSLPEEFVESTLVDSAGVCITGFSTQNLVAVLGGSYGETATAELRGFDQVLLYDTESKRWHTQKTFGDIPGGRRAFCAVGVRAGDIYNIYIYGGWGDRVVESSDVYGDVYVLSLPSFRWTRINVASDARTGQACYAISSQMIVSGGSKGYMNDPWYNSLGVFDMSKLEWQSSYDPDSPAYQVPESVEQNIANTFVEWNDDDVRRLFVPDTASNGDPSASPTVVTNPGQDDSTPISAIVGGTIGGVIALVVVGIAVYFLLRRRRRKSREQQPRELPNGDGAGEANACLGELPDSKADGPQEIDGRELRAEMDEQRPHTDIHERQTLAEMPS